jgi:hypothetical protein
MGFLWVRAFRPDRSQLGLRAARRVAIRGYKLERGMTYWRAEEQTSFVRHLEEPACPTLSTDLDPGIGQVAHDRQRLIARSRAVPQLDAFVVRQEASPGPEMEEIAGHVCSPSNSAHSTASRVISVWFQIEARRRPAAAKPRQGQSGGIARKMDLNESGIEQTVVAFDVTLKMPTSQQGAAAFP